MERVFYSLVFCTIVICSCNSGGGVNKLDYDKALTEIAVLKKELNDCKYGASTILANAKSLHEQGELSKALEELSKLDANYPTSNENIEGKKLAESINEVIAKENAEIQKKREQAMASATKNLSKDVDEVSGITFYQHKTSTKYINTNDFYTYIAISEGSDPWLRLKIQYAADDWLFIESVIVKVDDETFTLTEKEYGEFKTDHSAGKIWEWLDREVNGSELEMLKAIADAKKVIVRYNGRDYYKDKTLSAKQITAVKEVLTAFEALGGKLN